MKFPPLLLGATALFWGWQINFLLVAVPVALLLETPRFLTWRWELTSQDFRRLTILCTAAFLGLVIYQVLTADAARMPQALKTIRQWLPLLLLPLVAAQLYSTTEQVELNTLLFFFRKKFEQTSTGRPAKINLVYPYFALLLLSASAVDERNPWFYLGFWLLTAGALWQIRPKQYSLLLWGVLVVGAAGLGYAGHIGLHQLQRVVQGKIIQWVTSFTSGGATDPYQSRTAIGHIGEMKLSDEIMLRVQMTLRPEGPILLHQTSYNRYGASSWFARNVEFDLLKPEQDGLTWKLQPATASGQSVSISAYLDGGKGVLALPLGTIQLEDLAVGEAKRNRLGAVKVEDGPGLLTYTARTDLMRSTEAPPDEADLSIPQNEASAIKTIATELALPAKAPRQILLMLSSYFGKNFRYSTYQAGTAQGSSALADFLTRTKAGHCEYFASATVLLLRAAGVPARYATGYAVQEYNDLEGLYLARARDAHSWVRVYVDGAWEDFDTTPASWAVVESKNASRWEPFSDIWAWVKFQYSRWRWGEKGNGVTTYAAWLLVPLIAVLAWRLYRAKRVAGRRIGRKQIGPVQSWPGEDSEFYTLEKRFDELGLGRHPWEPVSAWLARIKTTPQVSASPDGLETIVSLHNRYRFDPHGISTAEREALSSGVRSWLKQHKE